VLREVADGVLVRQSEFCQSNAVVVIGASGALLVDAGVNGSDLVALADELDALEQRVVAGFSTHPHWDHLVWHTRFGSAPRYGTQRCALTARARLTDARAKAARIAEGVPLELLGLIEGLPEGTVSIPWHGPSVRMIEHRAHAPGHAALLIEDRGVLVAGDMLSDVEVPLLDLDAETPIEDYLEALRMFDAVTGEVDAVIPGHGSIGDGEQLRRRIDQDRAYVLALREGSDPADARVGASATYGRDWLPAEHRRQVEYAQKQAVSRRAAPADTDTKI
jgi:glyoxylase-like metal-dependent hydrolase (beta-lactamase superfamily II)